MLAHSICLLLFFVFQTGECSDCEPGFADTCFSSVSNDLKIMINLDSMVARNVSDRAVDHLCRATADSLDCTYDIIDADCSENNGSKQFVSWLKAFRASFHAVCSNHQKPLTPFWPLAEIIRGVSCWSLQEFFMCSEQNLNLKHISDLLHTSIGGTECQNLHDVLYSCWKEAQVDSCRETEDVASHVTNMISAFLDSAGCRDIDSKLIDASHSTKTKSMPWYLLIGFMSFLVLL